MKEKITKDYISKQLEVKKNELDKKRESFGISVQNELYADTSGFEQYAIAVLVSMAKLKSEISALEQLQLLTTNINE